MGHREEKSKVAKGAQEQPPYNKVTSPGLKEDFEDPIHRRVRRILQNLVFRRDIRNEEPAK
jgi:hypothetical protein